jgi:hypothetical protein
VARGPAFRAAAVSEVEITAAMAVKAATGANPQNGKRGKS